MNHLRSRVCIVGPIVCAVFAHSSSQVRVGAQSEPGVLVGWRGEIVRCERISPGSIHLYLRSTGLLVNNGTRDLIVPRRRSLGAMDVILNPAGTPPWTPEWSQDNEGTNFLTRAATTTPDPKYFETLKPDSGTEVVVSDVLSMSTDRHPSKAGPVATIGVRVFLDMGSRANEQDNVMLTTDQARMWEGLGVTMPSLLVAPWIRVALPKACVLSSVPKSP